MFGLLRAWQWTSGLAVVAVGVAVPIRYVLGLTANVVPVETVLVWEAGAVPCRVEAGPSNVVPVREAPGETPRVKIMVV